MAAIKMTAGFYVRAALEIWASPKSSEADRDRVREELRQIVQAAADAEIIDLVRSENLGKDET